MARKKVTTKVEKIQNAPKPIEKLTIQQKRKFVELYKAHAPMRAYNAYLGLANDTIAWLKENADNIISEVDSYEVERDKKATKMRAEAIKENEIARDKGFVEPFPDYSETKKVSKKWHEEIDKKVFYLESQVRSVKWLTDKYHPNPSKSAMTEIDSLVSEVEKEFG